MRRCSARRINVGDRPPHIYWEDGTWKANYNGWICVGKTPLEAYRQRMSWEVVKK